MNIMFRHGFANWMILNGVHPTTFWLEAESAVENLQKSKLALEKQLSRDANLICLLHAI